jgi:hypothetical protein
MHLTTLNLTLSNSPITDLGALTELKHLTTLNLALRGSKISDLGALKNIPAKHIKLDIRNTNIKNLKNLPIAVTELAVGN